MISSDTIVFFKVRPLSLQLRSKDFNCPELSGVLKLLLRAAMTMDAKGA